MPKFQHDGLFFGDNPIQTARKDRDRAPFTAAWAFLEGSAPSDSIAAMVWHGFRARLLEDADSLASAITALNTLIESPTADFAALETTIALAQTYELVRGQATDTAWENRFASRIDMLNAQSSDALVDSIWLGLVNLTAGILLEDETRLDAGVATYHHIIEHEVRPEGYLPRAVEPADGSTLARQLLSVQALVLMTEAAAQIGVDLWAFNSRGISVTTAGAYCIYYYYYPEKWPWETMTREVSAPLYRDHGGFFEMLNHAKRPKDLKLMLDEQRPFFNPTGGGLTTLTHGLGAKKGFFG